MNRNFRLLLVLTACCSLAAGCRGHGESSPEKLLDTTAPIASAAPSRDTASTPTQPVTIDGAPQKSVLVGELFEFAPVASSLGRDPLQFSIANRPRWAAFDAATGRLSGKPTQEDVGTYENVRISVSSGRAGATLPAFSLQVTDVATGHAVVSWEAPADNVDGSPLTGLAGFRVYYGKRADQLTSRLDIANAGVASVVIGDLSPATWYFAVAAYSRDHVEGELSEVVPYAVL